MIQFLARPDGPAVSGEGLIKVLSDAGVKLDKCYGDGRGYISYVPEGGGTTFVFRAVATCPGEEELGEDVQDKVRQLGFKLFMDRKVHPMK